MKSMFVFRNYFCFLVFFIRFHGWSAVTESGQHLDTIPSSSSSSSSSPSSSSSEDNAPSVTLHNIVLASKKSKSILGKKTIRGKKLSPNVDVYYGIPYGQAEIWRSPKEPREEQWGRSQYQYGVGGVAGDAYDYDYHTKDVPFDATKPTSACFNDDGSVNGTVKASSQWCLTIDVYTPHLLGNADDKEKGIDIDIDRDSNDNEQKITQVDKSQSQEVDSQNVDTTTSLPVIVFFQGSCFAGATQADSGQPFLEALTRINKKAIFISVMHRSGQLGHSASEGLWRENEADNAKRFFGNWALQDALLALNFLQQHIHSFNGDPRKVTVYGQSSGACLVSALYSSKYSLPQFNENRKLFHAVIADSGGFNGWCTVGMEVAEKGFEGLYGNGLDAKGGGGSHGGGGDPCGGESSRGSSNREKKKCMRDWLLENGSEEEIAGWGVNSVCFTGCDSTLVVDVVSDGETDMVSDVDLLSSTITDVSDQSDKNNSKNNPASTANRMSSPSSSVLPPSPSSMLPSFLLDILASGMPGVDYMNVPLLHGTMLDDGQEFMDNSTDIRSEEDFRDYVDISWGFAWPHRNGGGSGKSEKVKDGIRKGSSSSSSSSNPASGNINGLMSAKKSERGVHFLPVKSSISSAKISSSSSIAIPTSSPQLSPKIPLQDFLDQAAIYYNPSNSYLTSPPSGMHPAYSEGDPLPKNITRWILAAERMYTEWEYSCPTLKASELISNKRMNKHFNEKYSNGEYSNEQINNDMSKRKSFQKRKTSNDGEDYVSGVAPPSSFASAPAPVWEFTYVRHPPEPGSYYVTHSSEFNSLSPDFSKLSKEDTILAERMVRVWWEFADSGKAFWPPYGKADITGDITGDITADISDYDTGTGDIGDRDKSRSSDREHSSDRESNSDREHRSEKDITNNASTRTNAHLEKRGVKGDEKGKPFSFTFGVGEDWGKNAALDRVDRCGQVWNKEWRVWQGKCILAWDAEWTNVGRKGRVKTGRVKTGVEKVDKIHNILGKEGSHEGVLESGRNEGVEDEEVVVV